MSIFASIPSAPPDAILGLTEAFNKDSAPNKINLGVGVYKDKSGETPILESVKTAEARILAATVSKSYMPIGGSPVYRQAVQEMLFGKDHPVLREDRARTAHTPGGTGGLRVGADFLKKQYPNATVWTSTPTWANHKGIFSAAGFQLADYRYYDPATKGLNEEAMLEDLASVPAGDIVLLHVCCHNPTGVDPSPAMWTEIGKLAAEKGWLPFLDFAYQGFGAGVNEDRAGLLEIAGACRELVVASSFSKNFGLYQDRTGALTLVGDHADIAEKAFSNVEIAIRTNYSNPPAHGGLIVETILADDSLTDTWLKELEGMRNRIAAVRNDFVDRLSAKGVDRDFSFIKQQNGMFSFSGLSDEHVAALRDRFSIYIVKGGRINVAGITPSNIDYLCDAVATVLA